MVQPVSYSARVSHAVWLAGSGPEMPEIDYHDALTAAGHELHHTIFVGSFFENLETPLERLSPPTAVIVEDWLARGQTRRATGRSSDRPATEDIAPFVPRLLRAAGIAVPTVYVQGERPINGPMYVELGYSAIVAPTPHTFTRVAAAVAALQHLNAR